MATKPRNPIPTYRRHQRTGRAIITVRRAIGSRRDILLPGEFNSAESRQEYERILAILRTNGGNLPPENGHKTDLSIAELILRFMQEHVATYYVDPVTKEPSSEQEVFKLALRPLTRLFGKLPAVELGKVVQFIPWFFPETGNGAHEGQSKVPFQDAQLVTIRSMDGIGLTRPFFSWSANMDFHPYAKTYPELDGADYEAFRADILASGGPREPVKYRVLKDGTKQGLDGRNRIKACNDLKIPCPEEYVQVEDEIVALRCMARCHVTVVA
jgi:hypothetical protein